MLQHAQSWFSGSSQPLSHRASDTSESVLRIVSDSPIGRILIPGNSLQTEDTASDGSDSVVDITERWPPEGWDSSSVEVRNDLNGPAEFSEDLLVG